MMAETHAHVRVSIGCEGGADVGDVESGGIERTNVGLGREQELTFSCCRTFRSFFIPFHCSFFSNFR